MLKILKDKLVSNSLWLLLGSAVMTGLGFVFWVIITKIFSPSQIGHATVFISAAEMISAISLLGFDIALIKYMNLMEKKDKLIGMSILFSTTVGVVLSLAFIFNSGIFSIGINNYLAYVFLLLVISTTIFRLIDSVLVGLNRSKFLFIKSLIFSVLKIVLLFIAFQSPILESWLIATIVAVLFGFLWLGSPVRFVVDNKIFRKVWRFSGVNYISNLLILAPQTLFPLLILKVLGPAQSAFFYMVWLFSTAIYMIPNSVSKALLAQSSGLRSNLIKSMRYSFGLLFPTVLIVLIFAEPILFLFGKAYAAKGAELLRLTAVASFPLTINMIYISLLNLRNRIGLVMVINMILTVSTLVFGYIFLPYGIQMIGYFWLGIQLIVSIPVSLSLLKVVRHG